MAHRSAAKRTVQPQSAHGRAGTAVLAKGLRRHDDILDAAISLLASEGHAGLSMRKIAARVGIRLGNLQYYFRTRQDVLRALLERCLERSSQDLERAMTASGSAPRGRLRAGIGVILQEQRDPALCDLFREIWVLAARDPVSARVVTDFYDTYRAGLARLLLAVTPRLGRVRAERRATLLVALLEGLTVFRSSPDGRIPGERAIVEEIHAFALALADEERGD